MNANIRPVTRDIAQMVKYARDAAGGKDVYLDGGDLIRQALDAGLVDDLVVTLVPVLLGEGHTLFAGVEKHHSLEFVSLHRFGSDMAQLHVRPVS